MHPSFHYDAKVFEKLGLFCWDLKLIDLEHDAPIILSSHQHHLFKVIEPILPCLLSRLQLMPPQGQLQREASQPLQGGNSGTSHCHRHKVALVSGEHPGGLNQQLVNFLED